MTLRRTAMKRRYRNTGPPPEVVAAVYERAGYCDEITGVMLGDRRGIDHVLHHRRPRAIGGTQRPDTNSPANLLLLSPEAHDTVESRRGEALGMGWLVPQVEDPAAVPVFVHPGRWVYLTADGQYSDNPPGGDRDA